MDYDVFRRGNPKGIKKELLLGTLIVNYSEVLAIKISKVFKEVGRAFHVPDKNIRNINVFTNLWVCIGSWTVPTSPIPHLVNSNIFGFRPVINDIIQKTKVKMPVHRNTTSGTVEGYKDKDVTEDGPQKIEIGISKGNGTGIFGIVTTDVLY